MKPFRPWFQTSPRGTAKERFARLAHLLAGAQAPGPAALQAPEAARADSGQDGGLEEFFRNVAAGAHAHDLGDESLYLAEELADLQWSLSGRQKRALAVLVLASMISVRQGSSRLPLGRKSSTYLGQIVASLLQAGKLDLDAQALLRDIDTITRTITLDQIIGHGDQYRPLILADGCIYQHRMLWCENQLAARLRARIHGSHIGGGDSAGPATAAGDADIDRALARVLARPALAGGQPIVLSPEQQDAVRQAVARRLTVISGGPGTGKTAIVVSMLRVLCRLGEPVASIALAAPTGKAANRMGASIRQALLAVSAPAARDDGPDGDQDHGQDHDQDHALDDDLLSPGVEPQTLHRLLGYVPGVDRFRHHENNPLSATTIIVDEASMIDLALMERLLRAVPAHARLVLLGDADQLPSVDAGAVLRDLVLASERGHDFAVRLTRSYRMDPRNPAGRAILTAARAINTGDAPALLAADSDSPGKLATRNRPADLAWHGIELLDTGADLASFHAFCDHWYDTRIASRPDFQRLAGKAYEYRDGQWPEAELADLRALFAVYDRSRLLTVTRRQDTGAEAVNRRLHRRVLAAASVDYNPELYPGEPVMMRRNDYERGLFNGDQGVVVRVTEDRGRSHHFRVVFPRGDGFAVFHLDALRMHVELAYALTVHKSQGSELDEVALLLPMEEIPLLTREMLYTGVTRARRAVVLVGTPALVRVAVARPGQRFSGLADKLGHTPDTHDLDQPLADDPSPGQASAP